jgi:hypothetical protein
MEVKKKRSGIEIKKTLKNTSKNHNRQITLKRYPIHFIGAKIKILFLQHQFFGKWQEYLLEYKAQGHRI